MSGFPSISAEAQRAAAPRFNRRSVQSRTHRRPGRIYPEQSSRQALRGSRIAQGGPGIYLGGDHRYHAVF